jgi:hypothetical protein
MLFKFSPGTELFSTVLALLISYAISKRILRYIYIHQVFIPKKLILGIGSSPMYISDTDIGNVIKASQPPIIELPINAIDNRQHRPSNLTRAPILRTNDSGTQSYDNDQRITVLRPTVVQSKEVVMGRARRILTDDGNADVVHHIGIVSPPLSYSIIKPPPTQKRTTITTSTSDQYEAPRVTTVAPPDFVDRSQAHIRPVRVQSNIVQPHTDGLIDGAVSTSQQVLFKDEDYDPNLRRPVQVKIYFNFGRTIFISYLESKYIHVKENKMIELIRDGRGSQKVTSPIQHCNRHRSAPHCLVQNLFSETEAVFGVSIVFKLKYLQIYILTSAFD